MVVLIGTNTFVFKQIVEAGEPLLKLGEVMCQLQHWME